MSFRLQVLAWAAPIDATAKIVLLRLVDHADDEGGSIFPSIRSVAAVCGCSPRSVQRAVAHFLAIGILILVKEADYRARRPRQYRLNIARLAEMAKATEQPVPDSHQRQTVATPVTHSREPVPHRHPEPIKNPIKEPTKKGAVAPCGRYAWEGRVIKASERDYSAWKKACPHIPDLDAELQAADAYYTENPPKNGKWYFPLSGWLKKANAAAMKRQPVGGDVLAETTRLYRAIGVS
jgi:hypothetical protein